MQELRGTLFIWPNAFTHTMTDTNTYTGLNTQTMQTNTIEVMKWTSLACFSFAHILNKQMDFGNSITEIRKQYSSNIDYCIF